MRAKINLETLEITEIVSALPACLEGLLDESLIDLGWTDPTLELQGYGYWPAVEEDVTLPSPLTHQIINDPDRAPLVDAEAKTVTIPRKVVPLPDEVLAANMGALRERRKAEATDQRWRQEVAGIVIGGIPVATDDRSKTLILGKRAKARENPDQTFRWKAVNGWVELTGAQIIAIADAVADHVQACFDREGELHDAIDAAETAEDVLAVDITAGWPE